MSAIGNVAREARAQKQKRRLILICLGALAFTAMLIARPLMRAWSSLQSSRHLAEARAAITRQDFMPALQAVENAARETPQDPETLRTLVQVLVGLNAQPEEILSTLGQIEVLGGMTPDMLLERAQAHLLRGDMLGTQRALNALTDTQRQSWEAVELEASLLLRQGRAVEAEKRLQATAAPFDSPDAIIRHAVLELALARGPQRIEARQTIWKTARAEGTHQRLALTVLSQDNDLSASEAAELLVLTDPHSRPDAVSLRQAAMGQAFRLLPERKEALIQKESEHAAGLPTELQVGYLLFLAKHQAPQAMREFLRVHGKVLAKERPADHLNLELEVLAKSKEWNGVQDILKTKRAHTLNTLTLSLWQAYTTAALEPHNPATLEHLQRAYRATENGRDHAGATRVADSAMNLGQPAFAAACYEELAAQPMLPSAKTEMLEKAIVALSQTRDTVALRRVAHALAEQSHGHLGHAYYTDYLDILCGEPLESIVQRIHTHVGTADLDSIAQAHQRLLWAMIYNRRDQKDILRRELDGLEKRITWTAGERAVLAGLLATVGETSRAWQLAETLPESILLAEEAELLRKAK